MPMEPCGWWSPRPSCCQTCRPASHSRKFVHTRFQTSSDSSWNPLTSRVEARTTATSVCNDVHPSSLRLKAANALKTSREHGTMIECTMPASSIFIKIWLLRIHFVPRPGTVDPARPPLKAGQASTWHPWGSSCRLRPRLRKWPAETSGEQNKGCKSVPLKTTRGNIQ